MFLIQTGLPVEGEGEGEGRGAGGLGKGKHLRDQDGPLSAVGAQTRHATQQSPSKRAETADQQPWCQGENHMLTL